MVECKSPPSKDGGLRFPRTSHNRLNFETLPVRDNKEEIMNLLSNTSWVLFQISLTLVLLGMPEFVQYFENTAVYEKAISDAQTVIWKLQVSITILKRYLP